MGREVVLVSSADETAFAVAAQLADLGLARGLREAGARHRFLSSGDVDWFRQLGRQLLGPELDRTEAISWG